MSPAILINLLFPVVTGLILWLMKPVDGSFVTYNFILWFGIGAALQILAAFVLMGRNHRRWVLGWTLLWIASAAYMGSYAPAHIQDNVIGSNWSKLQAPKPAFPGDMEVSDSDQEDLVVRQTKWSTEKEAADAWFRKQYKSETAEESYEAFAKRDLATSAYLLYILAFVFLSAFFSISWFAGRGRLHEYDVEGGSEEDPLAKNDMGQATAGT